MGGLFRRCNGLGGRETDSGSGLWARSMGDSNGGRRKVGARRRCGWLEPAHMIYVWRDVPVVPPIFTSNWSLGRSGNNVPSASRGIPRPAPPGDKAACSDVTG